MQQTNIQTDEPPSPSVVIPFKKKVEFPQHEVIRLAPEDAARFHAGLEEVRARMPAHWMKNKDLGDLTKDNSIMLGIEQNGELVAGALVTTFKRQLGNKLYWYPWEARGDHTGLISSVWGKVSGQHMGQALIKQAIQEIRNSENITSDDLRGGARYALAGIAKDNAASRHVFTSEGFQEVGPSKKDPTHGKDMVYVRFNII